MENNVLFIGEIKSKFRKYGNTMVVVVPSDIARVVGWKPGDNIVLKLVRYKDKNALLVVKE